MFVTYGMINPYRFSTSDLLHQADKPYGYGDKIFHALM